jgi:hypothetical protein
VRGVALLALLAHVALSLRVPWSLRGRVCVCVGGGGCCGHYRGVTVGCTNSDTDLEPTATLTPPCCLTTPSLGRWPSNSMYQYTPAHMELQEVAAGRVKPEMIV